MRAGNAIVHLALIGVLGCHIGAARAGSLSVGAGLAYDFFSQEYFLDSVSLAGADSVLTGWEMTTDYLDDVKGQFWLTYSPTSDARTELTVAYDHAPEFIRTRLSGHLSSQWNDSRLRINGELEGKNRYSGEADFGDSYIMGDVRARLAVPVTSSINMLAGLGGDGVRFRSVSAYSYNYYRLEGRLGLEKQFPDFSFASLTLRVQTRRVPDTTELNYHRIGAEAAYFGFYGGGELDLYSSIENKRYRKGNDQDNHYRYELTGRNKNHLLGGASLRQELGVELVDYGADDPVNFDYSRLTVVALIELAGPEWTFGLGPIAEFFSEQESDVYTGEDYSDLGVRAALEYMRSGASMWSVQSDLGRRDLKSEGELQSDFVFERLTLIGDQTIAGSLRLSLLLSTEWEWHSEEDDNTRVLLISSNLGYEF